MQVTETLNSGLKREIKITVPAGDLEAKLLERLSEASSKARIKGFRPGKVPVQHLRKMYGKSFMSEIVGQVLSDSTRDVLSGRGEKAAMQPDIKMAETEKEVEDILSGKVDFEFTMSYEVIPAIEIKDYTGIKVTRLVYDVPAEEIDEQVRRVAQSARSYEAKDGKAENGDRLTIDFVGKIDGTPFDGGAATGQFLVLGSGQFIPGFEDQLVGVKAGQEKTITVTFPTEYNAAELAGKEATFDITVSEVASPAEMELNDELAKNLGLESLEQLRRVVGERIESELGSVTRQKVKRELLDQLDESYKFEAPSRLIEAEFNNIWKQVEDDLARNGRTFEDDDTTEEEARSEYRALAERRVRLGLVLSEIGQKAGVQVTDEETQRAVLESLRQLPRERQVEFFNFYRDNPAALDNVRAPLFEEKVIDHLLSQVAVTDKKVSKEELLADDDDEIAAAKPAKKAKSEKAKPEKAGAEKTKPEKAKSEKAGAAKADDSGASETPKKKAAPKKKATSTDAE